MPRLNCWEWCNPYRFFVPLLFTLVTPSSPCFLHTHHVESGKWRDGEREMWTVLVVVVLHILILLTYTYSAEYTHAYTQFHPYAYHIYSTFYACTLCTLHILLISLCECVCVRLHFTRSHTYRKQQMKWNKKPNNQHSGSAIVEWKKAYHKLR